MFWYIITHVMANSRQLFPDDSSLRQYGRCFIQSAPIMRILARLPTQFYCTTGSCSHFLFEFIDRY